MTEVDEFGVDVGDIDIEDKMVKRSLSKNLIWVMSYLIPDIRQTII